MTEVKAEIVILEQAKNKVWNASNDLGQFGEWHGEYTNKLRDIEDMLRITMNMISDIAEKFL